MWFHKRRRIKICPAFLTVQVYVLWLRHSNFKKKAFSWSSYSFGPLLYVPAKCILAELLLLYIQTLTEIGRGKQRPKSAAATCQTALRMIEDNLELQHKHPSRLSLCTQPLLLHREPWWCRGGWGGSSDGGGQESFMTWQKYWKWYLYGPSKGEYCRDVLTEGFSAE